MRIESVKIVNFRSFKNETIVFNDYTCLVGPNGAGKSTILNALNVFFRQSKDTQTNLSKLTAEDFHHKNTNEPIEITVTFTDLSDKAKEDLSDYVRQGKLIVSSVAEYNFEIDSAEVKQFGNRLGFEAFKKYFEADKNGVKVKELKDIYRELKNVYTELPNQTTKTNMADALKSYESVHPEKCTLLRSEDEFYGISRGKNRLAPHIQWIFVSASKDVSEECEESRDSTLEQLLARTVRSKVNFTEKMREFTTKAKSEYQSILDQEQNALDGISKSLQVKLEAWSRPGISAKVLWKQDSDKSVRVEEPWAYIKIGERGFEGDLLRFGHGLQRSFMLALLQELTTVPDEYSPILIMAIEEPEIYQHPPQARHLAEILHDLSNKNSQIIICSHHPLFIPGDDFEAIRIVREKGDPSSSYISQLKYSELTDLLQDADKKVMKEEGMLAKLYSSLNPIINEMFFCNILILTEGIEDVAYLSTYLMLNDKMDDFRRYGCHIIPVGGKDEIIKPLAMAQLLNIPVFIVCDADTEKTKEDEVTKHKKANKKIQELLKISEVNEWPDDNIFNNNIVVWQTNLTEIIKHEIGENWNEYKRLSEDYYGKPGNLNKNPLFIARILELAWKDGIKSALLLQATNNIIKFAEENNNLS